MQEYGRISRYGQRVQRMTRLAMERDGIELRYTPRSRCSCRREDGQAQVGCRVCEGFGWFWQPDQERRVRAIVQNAQLDREYADYGVVTRGDLVCVFDRRTDAAPYDRVRLTLDQLRSLDCPTEAEVVERGDGESDALSQRVAKMVDLLQTNPWTGTYLVYRDREDYYTSGNMVIWRAGRGPLPGQSYACTYLADYDWIATQPPVPRHAGTTGVAGKLLLTRRVRDQRDTQDLAADPAIPELDERSAPMDEQTRLLLALARLVERSPADGEARTLAEHAVASARDGAFGHAAQRAVGAQPDERGADNLEWFVVAVLRALDEFLRAEARQRAA